MKVLSINQDFLKILALISMTIDHISKVFSFPLSDIGVGIGRISFPIFGFLLMQHLYQKKIFTKYIKRLSFFAVLSFLLLYPFVKTMGYMFVFPFNILFSFLNAVVFLKIHFLVSSEAKTSFIIKKILCGTFFLIFLSLSILCDYSWIGFIYLISCYFYFQNPCEKFKVLALLCSFGMNSFPYGIISFITTFVLMGIKDNRGMRYIKHWWIFYVYYPLHILVLNSIFLLNH